MGTKGTDTRQAGCESADRTGEDEAITTSEIPLENRDISKVWMEYKRTSSPEIRGFFLRKYLKLVEYTAFKLHAKLPASVDVEDLISVGNLGLVRAIEGFDPDRGVKFESYCSLRIRGAILDELRRTDWVPRLARTRSTRVINAQKSFHLKHGRRPTQEELAEELGASGEDLKRIISDSSLPKIVSIHQKQCEISPDDDGRELDFLEDRKQPDLPDDLAKNDLFELITRGLNRKERLILVLYYYENMSISEVGRVLGRSESSVFRLLQSVIDRLKMKMRGRRSEFVFLG